MSVTSSIVRGDLGGLIGYTGNRSRILPPRGKKDGVAQGIGRHRRHSFSHRKDAGRILEAAGSTCDLKRHVTVGHSIVEINAIPSLRETDFQ